MVVERWRRKKPTTKNHKIQHTHTNVPSPCICPPAEIPFLSCTFPVSSKHFIIPYFSRRVDSLMTKLWFRLHMYLRICVFASFVCVQMYACDCERVHVYTFAKHKINIYTQHRHQHEQQQHSSLRSSHFPSFFLFHFVSVCVLFLRHQTNVAGVCACVQAEANKTTSFFDPTCCFQLYRIFVVAVVLVLVLLFPVGWMN